MLFLIGVHKAVAIEQKPKKY